MKRTPPWVYVAAVGVQLAALGLCLWAMERNLPTEVEAPAPPELEPKPSGALAPALPLPLAAQDVAFVRDQPATPQREPEPIFVRAPDPVPEPAAYAAPEPEPEPEPETEPAAAVAAEPEPAAVAAEPEPEPPRGVPIRAGRPEAATPRFGPPPPRPPEPPPDPNAVPRFITEFADATSQVVGGRVAEGRFAFGFYPDGNIRFVDVDGGRYAGKAESARARLREVDGMRAFTVQIGVADDRRLQATFTGGTHNEETVALEPLVGWTVV